MAGDTDAPAPEPVDVSGLKGEPRAALALAAGATITDAAQQAGISERTIRRRLELPDYRIEISRLRAKVLDAAVGRLVDAMGAAVETLAELLDARSEHARLGAAKAILEFGLSLQEALETQSRISTLEQLYVERRTQTFTERLTIAATTDPS